MTIDVSLLVLVFVIFDFSVFWIWFVRSAPQRAKNRARKIAGQWLVKHHGIIYTANGKLEKVFMTLENENKKIALVFGPDHPSLKTLKALSEDDAVNFVFNENPKPWLVKQVPSAYLLTER